MSERIERVLFDNEDNEQTGGGVRTKTNFVYNTVQNWQQQVKGGRIIVAGVVFLIASGAITYVVNLVTGGGP